MLNVGFTATRRGMTPEQMDSLRRVLRGLDNLSLHHSDREGGEYQAHVLARELGVYVVSHPPIRDDWRAWSLADEQYPPKDKFFGKELVDSVDLMIAAPSSSTSHPLNWTWATVKYALSSGKKVLVINPDGKVDTRGTT